MGVEGEGFGMKVAKIMRKDVVALRADEPIETAWRQMRDQRFTALPVTDAAGCFVGLLTEHDLVARLAPRRARRWWNVVLDGTDGLAADYVKSVGVTAGDLLSPAPVMIDPDASVEAAADLMRRHSIGALPVVADGVCVGLLTSAEILDHLSWPTADGPGAVADVDLERSMCESIRHESWASTHRVTVEAIQGTLRLTGVVTSAAERSALIAMARSMPGCAGVENRVVVLTRRSAW
jgi:CBS domain-containing protein